MVAQDSDLEGYLEDQGSLNKKSLVHGQKQIMWVLDHGVGGTMKNNIKDILVLKINKSQPCRHIAKFLLRSLDRACAHIGP